MLKEDESLRGIALRNNSRVSWIMKANQIAMTFGTFISNPLTAVPLAIFFVRLGAKVSNIDGDFLLRIKEMEENGISLKFVTQQGADFFLVYFAGSFLTAVVSIPIAYYVSKALIIAYRNRRTKRLANRRKEIRTQTFLKSDIKSDDQS